MNVSLRSSGRSEATHLSSNVLGLVAGHRILESDGRGIDVVGHALANPEPDARFVPWLDA